MPSFQDSAVIFIIALLLFGPKKLPELARQLGKLMGEFRRASNDFRMQMEEELRMSEQAERQKEIAAMEAAAPAQAALAAPAATSTSTEEAVAAEASSSESKAESEKVAAAAEPLPIATAGELQMMPPSTGLPMARGGEQREETSALEPLLEAIPEAAVNGNGAEHTLHAPVTTHETQVEQHG